MCATKREDLLCVVECLGREWSVTGCLVFRGTFSCGLERRYASPFVTPSPCRPSSAQTGQAPLDVARDARQIKTAALLEAFLRAEPAHEVIAEAGANVRRTTTVALTDPTVESKIKERPMIPYFFGTFERFLLVGPLCLRRQASLRLSLERQTRKTNNEKNDDGQ